MTTEPTPPTPGSDPAVPPVPPVSPSPVPPAPVHATPLPTPNPAAAVLPRNRLRSGIVIAVVVGVVAGGGGAAALVNAARNDGRGDDRVEISQPAPVAPAVADAGPLPVAITLPGPQPAPAVTTVPATSEPVTTSVAPVDTQPTSEPPTSEGDPVITTAAPATAPASSPATVPPLAPPTTATAPAPPSPESPESSGQLLSLDAGVSFEVPAGWSVLSSSGGAAVVASATATLFVTTGTDFADATAALGTYSQLILDDVNDAQLGEIEPSQIYDSRIVDAAELPYQGYIGQGQSGSTYVRGLVFADMRVDGIVVFTDLMFIPAPEGGIHPSDSTAIDQFLATFDYGDV